MEYRAGKGSTESIWVYSQRSALGLKDLPGLPGRVAILSLIRDVTTGPSTMSSHSLSLPLSLLQTIREPRRCEGMVAP